MTHTHFITDTDAHFVISPTDRVITSKSNKTELAQYDHNSERFTFETPRYIEGHDMSLCDKVEIHFINIGIDKSNKSSGVYLVDDVAISPDSEDMVVFSWLISANATKYEGTLNFLIKFTCLTDDAIDYVWSTSIFKNVAVLAGMNNGEAVVEEHADILQAWKSEIDRQITAFEQTLGDVEGACDSIIAIQESLIGGAE